MIMAVVVLMAVGMTAEVIVIRVMAVRMIAIEARALWGY